MNFVILYIGALLITFLLTRVTNSLFRKAATYRTAAIISFVIFASLALLIGGTRMVPLRPMFFFYIPSLILWLLIDLHRASKRKCPFCGKSIQLSAVACKYCGRDIGTGATLMNE